MRCRVVQRAWEARSERGAVPSRGDVAKFLAPDAQPPDLDVRSPRRHGSRGVFWSGRGRSGTIGRGIETGRADARAGGAGLDLIDGRRSRFERRTVRDPLTTRVAATRRLEMHECRARDEIAWRGVRMESIKAGRGVLQNNSIMYSLIDSFASVYRCVTRQNGLVQVNPGPQMI